MMGRYSGVRKRGDVWYVNYYAGGRRIEERAPAAETAAEADEYRTERRRQVARGEWRPQLEAEAVQVGSSHTVAALLAWYRENEVPRLRGRSFALETLLAVERELGPVPVRAATAERVERWIARLRARGCGDSTIRKYVGRLRRVWKAAEASPAGRKILAGARNPVDGIRLPREPQGRRAPFPADALPKLLQAADAGPRWLGRWVRLCLYLGLRVHEARRLAPHQLDLQRGIAYPNGKTGERAVPIPAALLADVKAWALEAEDGSPIIGVTVPRPPYRVVATMLRRAGLEGSGLTMRNLRTTFIRQARSAGVDLATLADVNGHDLDTLRRWYADSDVDERRRAVETAAAAIGGRAVATKKGKARKRV